MINDDQQVVTVAEKKTLKSTGKGRCLVRAWLQDNTLHTNIQRAFANESVVKKMYADGAIMRQEFKRDEVHRILDTLRSVRFELSLDRTDNIDTAW
jgi:hypothetical protein